MPCVSQSENIKHAFITGLKTPNRGEDHPMHVLGESDVIEIRKMHNMGGITKRELSEIYNVHEATVGLIVNNKTWRHL